MVTFMASTMTMANGPMVIERTFEAPVDRVWRALTDPAQMRVWYFPMMEDFRAEVGFETRFNVHHEGRDFLHIWKVTEVVPGKKISYEWRFGGYPGHSLLTWELFGQMGMTWVRLTHAGLGSFRGDLYPELFRDNFVQGWTRYMCDLGDYLKG